MTLPPLAQIVKRARSEPFASLLVGLASFLIGALIVLAFVDRVVAAQATARMDRMGTALAEMTASIGLPAVLQQDRIALGNLASRVTDFDEVIGCSLYTVDGRTLAFDGVEANDPDSKHYTAPIAVEDTLAGYARVVLDRRRFRAAPGDLFLAAWPLVPGAMAAAVALLLFRMRRRKQAPALAGMTEVGADMKFVLVANLFNQGSLRPLRAKTVLAHAMEHAVATAHAHGGRAQPLPGARMLIAFDDDSATDRPFDVVCAALDFGAALAPSLPEADGPPAPSFRFGLHLCEASADEASVLESAQVSDAVLLSALAPDGRLAISQDVYERIERADRLDLDTPSALSQAALTGTTLGRCRIVKGVAGDVAPDSPPNLRAQ